MKKLSIFVGAFVGLLASCESTRYAPPVVASQMTTARKGQQVDTSTLREGRRRFVHRCIECHVLPGVASHTAARWPALIDEMASRANLNPTERNAVLAYILAERAQTK